jgi:hypothetical protein
MVALVTFQFGFHSASAQQPTTFSYQFFMATTDPLAVAPGAGTVWTASSATLAPNVLPYFCIPTAPTANEFWIGVNAINNQSGATVPMGNVVLLGKQNLEVLNTPTITVASNNGVVFKCRPAFNLFNAQGLNSYSGIGHLQIAADLTIEAGCITTVTSGVNFRAHYPIIGTIPENGCIVRNASPAKTVVAFTIPSELGNIQAQAQAGTDRYHWVYDLSNNVVAPPVWQPISTQFGVSSISYQNSISLDLTNTVLPIRVGVIPGVCNVTTNRVVPYDPLFTLIGGRNPARMTNSGAQQDNVINETPQLAYLPCVSMDVRSLTARTTAGSAAIFMGTVNNIATTPAMSSQICLPPFFVDFDQANPQRINDPTRPNSIWVTLKMGGTSTAALPNDFTYTINGPVGTSGPLVRFLDPQTPGAMGQTVRINIDNDALFFTVTATRTNKCGASAYTFYFNRTREYPAAGGTGSPSVCAPPGGGAAIYFTLLKMTAGNNAFVPQCPGTIVSTYGRPDGVSWHSIEAVYSRTNSNGSIIAFDGPIDEDQELDWVFPTGWENRAPDPNGV